MHAARLATLTIDAGVQGPPHFVPDISREQIFAAAGTTLAAVLQAGDRGKAVETAALGAARLVADLAGQGKVEGILCLGGSAGTVIGTAAMRVLPFGIPKVMVSTMASGQVKQYVGVRDILMLHSVVDISGLNRISRTVLANAAYALVGMARGQKSEVRGQTSGSRDKNLLAATMFGVTTPCVSAARQILEQREYEVLVFHATGTGGMTMEAFIADTAEKRRDGEERE